MTVSLRLEKELEQELAEAAATAGLTKSDLIRQCLIEFLARKRVKHLAWELGKGVFGRYGSGRGNLSRDRKRVVRERIHAKKGRRRLRTAGRAVR